MRTPSKLVSVVRTTMSAIVFAVILACGGGGGSAPPMQVTLSPSSLTMKPGETKTVTVRVQRQSFLGGAVDLQAKGYPLGVTATFNPTRIPANETTSVLTLVAAPNAADAVSSVEVSAKESSNPAVGAILNLVVSDKTPDFNIVVDPTIITDFLVGHSRTITFDVNAIGGYVGGVNLSLVSGSDDFLAEDLSSNFVSLATGKATGTFKIRYLPSGSLQEGILVTIKGTSGGISREATVYCRTP